MGRVGGKIGESGHFPEGREKAHILFVDDDADTRKHVRALLAPSWNVEVVANGHEALAALEARVPDLVVTDVLMPELDGFGLVKALRADERTRLVPVIMLSARAGEDAHVEGLKAGADDYLSKPFSARELLARIQTHLELGRLRNMHVRETERAMLLISEQVARAQAEHANRLKDEFLARISHELATPLLAMRLWLDVLTRGDSAKWDDAVEALGQCIEAQSKLIEDLLNTSRAMTGKLTVSLEACEPAEPIEAAVVAIRPIAEQKGLKVNTHLSATSLVQADPSRLQQILANLLSNAVKFTSQGQIDVWLDSYEGGVRIRVSDTGRGFPANFRPLLFSPFRQEEEGTTRSAGGLGLGLAIARQLVELHGGKIWADSPGRGQGATFTVWLSSLQEISDEIPNREPLAQVRALAGLRILLVEDDETTRFALMSLLNQHGAEVNGTASAAIGLRALGGSPLPDIVLCDIAMPGEDGYSFIRKVRAQGGALAALPAAALTAHMREEDRARALAAGFQMHIPKSVTAAQLVAQVQRLARNVNHLDLGPKF